jgi:hypothetical protein
MPRCDADPGPFHMRAYRRNGPGSASHHFVLRRVRGTYKHRVRGTKPAAPRPGQAYSAGIGVAGAVGAVAACEEVDGPRSGRSSIAIRNAMPNESTSAQARNTKRNA